MQTPGRQGEKDKQRTLGRESTCLALTDHRLLKQGGLAQLARAPALQAGGHRFDSDILHRSEKRKAKREEKRE